MFCSGHESCSEKHQFDHFEELYLQLAVKDQDHIHVLVSDIQGNFLLTTTNISNIYKIVSKRFLDFFDIF